ncbi:cofilin [Marchantia polymorpha subsp. ruderalis]|uniref:ADF-H domain-containing protein n=1 Tax=Marchantia polymorpha TaxID=3197 RepID=A0A2R6X8H1_MARPO|nr:hypothetical protein MARPO_0030s0115 [Marchantia polymorpha]BBN20271.1 hypothetical protein Mp_8g17810 [Marchantia polymorpha subsp. ruderalis]|eukprot:PTQ42390.1 hypothetical protein MARPO_0030s0115 [Marchantia polymorpha]
MAQLASGIRLDLSDDCKSKFMDLRTKKHYRYIIYKIDEKSQQIVVEKAGATNESYDTFAACLPESDCRFGVFDLEFTTDDMCQKSKIFFISWSPDTSRIKAKMMYASSKDRFRRELDGIHYELQATDPTEMDLEILKDRAS